MIVQTEPNPQQGGRRALLAALLVACVAAPAAATTYTIATVADDVVVNGNCTLREALHAANLDVAVDACPAGTLDDSIVLPSGTYDFRGEEVLNSAGSLSLTGADLNPFHVTVDLHGVGRFVSLSGGGRYVIAGVGITNGVAGSGDDRGGAIRAFDVTLRVSSFRLAANAAGSEGGALYYGAGLIGASRSLSVDHGTFLNNRVTNAALVPAPSGSGGAAFVSIAGGNDVDIRDVAFIGNSVTDTVGQASGGALTLALSDFGTSATCVRCSFDGNSVMADSVDRALGGAALVNAQQEATANLVDCRFQHNAVHEGAAGGEAAALFAQAATAASVNLERLFVDDNQGPIASGDLTEDVIVLAYARASVSLVDSQLTFGGAKGLNVAADSASVRLGHLTIADYQLAGASLGIAGTGQVVLRNSIVAFNPLGHDVELRAGSFTQTTNFIGGNPLFFDEPNGNYRLAPSSLAIDAGTGSVVTFRIADRDHHSRRAGAATDIGCYEYNSLFADDFEVGDLGSWGAFAPR